jgi:V8-like Glu-specific endopeptidase
MRNTNSAGTQLTQHLLARGARALALGLAVGSLVPACAPGSGLGRTGNNQNPIIGGVPHDGDPAVLYLTYDGAFSCTGSLIAPRVVLTAWHCVAEDSGPVRDASQFTVGTGPSAEGGEHYANVTRIEIQPGTGIENRDIALLVLDRAGSLTPYEIARAAPAAGDMMVGIGYGQTDGSRPGLPSGRKYRGQNRIGVVEAREIRIAGALACWGDSGGPGFVGDQVAGVVSRGTADTCEGSDAIYTRVDAFASWIDGIVREVEREPEGGGGGPGGEGTDPGGRGGDPGGRGGEDPGGEDPGGGDPGGEDPGGEDPGGEGAGDPGGGGDPGADPGEEPCPEDDSYPDAA